VFWRSCAKPFQLWPLVERGGVDRFGLTADMLALACASHNGEPLHRDLAAAWLRALGVDETALACGGHLSLAPRVAEAMIRERAVPGPLWSNCSGKHSAMIALALLERWPVVGYQRLEHPVQQAVAASVARWGGLEVAELAWGIDGCTAAAVAAPLDRLALAWARLGTSDDPSLRAIREAMLANPEVVAGSGRLDTALMLAWSNRILVKVGAEGVYAASLPDLGIGVALKVADGDLRAAAIALVAILEQLVTRLAPGATWPLEPVASWHEPMIRNTRGEVTGQTVLRGEIAFA
jgi:L-asparaginase II